VTPAARGRAPGNARRASIVGEAAQLATVIGLHGLSIGDLAAKLDMPKSSLYVLFGSKEELQLATVDSARESFVEHVIAPAFAEGADGRERLIRLAGGFLDYVRARVFPGGCFFVQAAAEVGGRRGPVHDRVVAYQSQWREVLLNQASVAHEKGEITDEPDQVAFEIGALLAGANLLAVLHDDNTACDRAEAALQRLL
jgi:AcrR family transcriptional regulator